ncbi:MAG: group II intron maturase-specific domain-containing protein [Egibacteraceae bacterium]
MSREKLVDKGREVRRWRLARRPNDSLEDLARQINPIVRGWMTYWGRFYRTEMDPLLRRINTYLMRWARKKYKRLRAFKRLEAWWEGVVKRDPTCSRAGRGRIVFIRLDGKSGVTGDCHAPFCGGPRVRPLGLPDTVSRTAEAARMSAPRSISSVIRFGPGWPRAGPAASSSGSRLPSVTGRSSPCGV